MQGISLIQKIHLQKPPLQASSTCSSTMTMEVNYNKFYVLFLGGLVVKLLVCQSSDLPFGGSRMVNNIHTGHLYNLYSSFSEDIQKCFTCDQILK